MPIVPRRDRAARVPTAPLSAPLASPDAPTAAFGVPGPGVDYGGAALRIVEPIAKKARDEADQVMINSANVALDRSVTDARTKALSRRGLDALGATNEAQASFDKATSDIRAGLTSDRQRFLFEQRVGARWADLYDTVERHTAAEHQNVDKVSTDTLMATSRSNAIANYHDDARVQHELDVQRALLIDFGRRNSVPQPLIDHEIAERVSELHTALISRYANTGDDRAAAAYYDKARDQMLGEDQATIDKVLAVASTTGASQRAADSILNSASDLNVALDAAATIDDPKVREATERRLRQHFEDRAFADRQERDQAFEDAKARLLKNGGDIEALPPVLRTRLNAAQDDELRRVAHGIRYPDHVTDEALYYSLANKAVLSESSRDEFLATDIRAKYGARLSRDDLERLENKQREIRQERLRATESAEQRQKRAEERRVIRGAEQASNAAGAIAASPELAKNPMVQSLLNAKKVPPTQWMIDSASRNPDYAKYLRDMGVDLPTNNGASTTGAPSVVTPRRAPGGPIDLRVIDIQPRRP